MLTACALVSAPGPTLGNEYGRTLPFKNYKTTEPTDGQFGASDYNGDNSPHLPKFKTIAPLRALRCTDFSFPFFSFSLFVSKFCSRPETRPHNPFLCGLLHMTQISSYCRWTKCRKFPFSLVFTSKNPTRGVSKRFQAKRAKYSIFVLSKPPKRFPINFTQ